MSRQWFEVRVRERKNGMDVKKSKFYRVPSPQDARVKYQGSGHIMWIRKVRFAALHGVGEFFSMGDRLLKELKELERAAGKEQVAEIPEQAAGADSPLAYDAGKAKKRGGYYVKRRKEATTSRE